MADRQWVSDRWAVGFDYISFRKDIEPVDNSIDEPTCFELPTFKEYIWNNCNGIKRLLQGIQDEAFKKYKVPLMLKYRKFSRKRMAS